MMTNLQYEFMTSLQYENRDLKRQLKEFKSGEKYLLMKAAHKKQLEAEYARNRKLEIALAQANNRTAAVHRNYLQVIEDMEKEHAKGMRAKDNRIEKLYERSLRGEHRANCFQDEIRDLKKLYYEVGVKLEEQEEINRKLVMQLNRDHENSSLPSSAKPTRKKIHNSREETGRNPGGQPGHKGHVRKKYEPTNRIEIEPPAEFLDSKKYEPTGKIISKQVVKLRITLDVDEFSTPEFLDLRTKTLVHASFPDGVVNEVSYDGSVKAVAFMLVNYCNVSIEKTRELLMEITGGQLEISHGMISGLAKEFSEKTEVERSKIYEEILHFPVVCTDFTSARNNGKQSAVLVCAIPGAVAYYARLHKGHMGIAGTLVEDYVGTLVHDHDMTFYNYGLNHQECNSHPLRYLKGSIENEPNLTWNVQIRGLMQEMIHYRNEQGDDAEPDLAVVDAFKIQWRKILEVARREYEYEPPSKYNKEGYNLYKRLDEYMDYHFTFLKDYRVPATNNFAERMLRLFKRKQHQAVTFRSFEGLSYFCDAMTVIGTLRLQKKNLYTNIVSYFS